MAPGSAAGQGLASLPRARLLALFYGSGIVLVGGGFVLYTSSVDPVLARETGAGSPLSQAILGFYYVTAAMLLLANPDGRRVMAGAWPIGLLPALALASVLWSPDPALTLRRGIAFAGTIVFGLSLGAAYRFRDVLALTVVSLTLAMFLSMLLVVVDPVRAIHQPDDAIQAVHAGYWRGLFAHRNTLGFWSGTGLAIIALAGGTAFRSRWHRAAALAAAAVCLVASGSSAGISIAMLAVVFFLVVTSILQRSGRGRVVIATLWALASLLVLLHLDWVARTSLQLLGRDSDLTGRTALWSFLVDLVGAADKPLGLGYFVGTLVLDQRLRSATQIHNVNAHNGFLEAYVYFGWTGVALAMLLAFWLLAGTLRLAAAEAGRTGNLASVPAVMVVLALAHNLVESTLVSPNNLNTVVLALAAAMLARWRIG